MAARHETQMKPLEELENNISKAINKMNVRKATDLCRYIPGERGRLHHFAFGKLKKTRPEELLKMIKEHILEKESPGLVASAPRAAQKVKRTIDVKLKRSHVNQILTILKDSGSKIDGAEDLISMLAPHQTLRQVQKLMLDMIRDKEVDQGLWTTYVSLVNEEKAALK